VANETKIKGNLKLLLKPRGKLHHKKKTRQKLSFERELAMSIFSKTYRKMSRQKNS
jgi:hypothetical protein